jgi:thiamine biosynthesis lipoprotein ApbE
MIQNGSGSETTDMDRGMMAVKDTSLVDVEQRALAEAHLMNSTVRNFTWKGVTVTVKDRESKQPKTIVDACEGIVEAGEPATRFWSASLVSRSNISTDRRDLRLDGPVGLRQDDVVERARFAIHRCRQSRV